MSIETLISEIKTLPFNERQHFFSLLFEDPDIAEEFERIGYLKMTEQTFSFWNDPREDVYQDFTSKVND